MSGKNSRSERGATMTETASLIGVIAVTAAMGIVRLGIMTQKPACDAAVPMQAQNMELSYDQHLQYSGGSGFRADEVRGDGKQGQCRIYLDSTGFGNAPLWNPVNNQP